MYIVLKAYEGNPFETSLVSIQTRSGFILGVGFLVDDNHVITCAHVIIDAWKLEGYGKDEMKNLSPPVYMNFHFLDPETIITSKVSIMKNPKIEDDIAYLTLNNSKPKGAEPLLLLTSKKLYKHEFGTFGFPPKYPGKWASGQIMRRIGKRKLQIEDFKVTGSRVQRGFSGAPVWDEQLQGVVGMVCEEDTAEEQKIANVIPSDVITEVCPNVVVETFEITQELTTAVEEVILNFLNRNWKQALPALKKAWEVAPTEFKGQHLKIIRSVLNALGSYFKAIKLISQNKDFIGAKDELQNISKDIERIGGKCLVGLTRGMEIYLSAIIESQKGNYNRAFDLFMEAKTNLEQTGQFVNQYQSFIDFMEPDMLFTSAQNAILQLDFIKAKILIDKASKSASKIADNYCEKDSPDYNKFKGASFYLQAYYKYFKVTNDFNLFDYDVILEDHNLTSDARKAIDFYKNADLTNAIVNNIFCLVEAILKLLEAIQESSKILKDSFLLDVHPKEDDIVKIEQKILHAKDSLSRLGLSGLPFIRYVAQLTKQANNIEKLVAYKKS